MFLFLIALGGAAWAAIVHYRDWRYWALWTAMFIIASIAIGADTARLARAGADATGVAAGASILGFAIPLVQRTCPANRKFFWFGAGVLVIFYAMMSDGKLLQNIISLGLIFLTVAFVWNKMRKIWR